MSLIALRYSLCTVPYPLILNDFEHYIQRLGALTEALLQRVDHLGQQPILDHEAPPVFGQFGLVVHAVENPAPEAAPAHHMSAGGLDIGLLDVLIVVEAEERAGFALLHKGIALDAPEGTNALEE